MNRKRDGLSDYKKIETTDKNGKKHIEIIYTGDYYIPSANEDIIKKYRIICWIFSFVILSVFIGMGLINNSGSRVLYVILPYICAFLPIGYMFSGCWYMTVSGMKMTKNQYMKSVKRLKKCTVAVEIMALMTFIGDIIYTVLNEKNINSGKEFLYMIIAVVSFIICLGFLKIQAKIQFSSEI